MNDNQFIPESPEYLIIEQKKEIDALTATIKEQGLLIKKLGEALENSEQAHGTYCDCLQYRDISECSCGAGKAIATYRQWKEKQK